MFHLSCHGFRYAGIKTYLKGIIMKNIKVIISAIAVLIVVALTTIIVFSTGILTKAQLTGETIKEIKDKNKDNIVAVLNGENIYQYEVSIMKWQNENINSKKLVNIEFATDEESILKELIRQKIILQEAKKLNIELSEEEILMINESEKKQYERNIEENTKFIEGLGISKEIFISELVEKEKNRIISSRFKQKIIPEIIAGKIKSSNDSINQKISDFNLLKPESNLNLDLIASKIQDIFYEYLDILISNSDLELK